MELSEMLVQCNSIDGASTLIDKFFNVDLQTLFSDQNLHLNPPAIVKYWLVGFLLSLPSIRTDDEYPKVLDTYFCIDPDSVQIFALVQCAADVDEQGLRLKRIKFNVLGNATKSGSTSIQDRNLRGVYTDLIGTYENQGMSNRVSSIVINVSKKNWNDTVSPYIVELESLEENTLAPIQSFSTDDSAYASDEIVRFYAEDSRMKHSRYTSLKQMPNVIKQSFDFQSIYDNDEQSIVNVLTNFYSRYSKYMKLVDPSAELIVRSIQAIFSGHFRIKLHWKMYMNFDLFNNLKELIFVPESNILQNQTNFAPIIFQTKSLEYDRSKLPFVPATTDFLYASFLLVEIEASVKQSGTYFCYVTEVPMSTYRKQTAFVNRLPSLLDDISSFSSHRFLHYFRENIKFELAKTSPVGSSNLQKVLKMEQLSAIILGKLIAYPQYKDNIVKFMFKRTEDKMRCVDTFVLIKGTSGVVINILQYRSSCLAIQQDVLSGKVPNFKVSFLHDILLTINIQETGSEDRLNTETNKWFKFPAEFVSGFKVCVSMTSMGKGAEGLQNFQGKTHFIQYDWPLSYFGPMSFNSVFKKLNNAVQYLFTDIHSIGSLISSAEHEILLFSAISELFPNLLRVSSSSKVMLQQTEDTSLLITLIILQKESDHHMEIHDWSHDDSTDEENVRSFFSQLMRNKLNFSIVNIGRTSEADFYVDGTCISVYYNNVFQSLSCKSCHDNSFTQNVSQRLKTTAHVKTTYKQEFDVCTLPITKRLHHPFISFNIKELIRPKKMLTFGGINKLNDETQQILKYLTYSMLSSAISAKVEITFLTRNFTVDSSLLININSDLLLCALSEAANRNIHGILEQNQSPADSLIQTTAVTGIVIDRNWLNSGNIKSKSSFGSTEAASKLVAQMSFYGAPLFPDIVYKTKLGHIDSMMSKIKVSLDDTQDYLRKYYEYINAQGYSASRGDTLDKLEDAQRGFDLKALKHMKEMMQNTPFVKFWTVPILLAVFYCQEAECAYTTEFRSTFFSDLNQHRTCIHDKEYLPFKMFEPSKFELLTEIKYCASDKETVSNGADVFTLKLNAPDKIFSVIHAQFGENMVIGRKNESNVFKVANGFKNLVGSDREDFFLLTGDEPISGLLNGKQSTNTLDFRMFHKDQRDVIIIVKSIEDSAMINLSVKRIGKLNDKNDKFLHIENVQRLEGRENSPDRIHVNSHVQYVSSNGGASMEQADYIYLDRRQDIGKYNISIKLMSNTVVFLSGDGDFEFIVESGPVRIFARPNYPITNSRFFFNTDLYHVEKIEIETQQDGLINVFVYSKFDGSASRTKDDPLLSLYNIHYPVVEFIFNNDVFLKNYESKWFAFFFNKIESTEIAALARRLNIQYCISMTDQKWIVNGVLESLTIGKNFYDSNRNDAEMSKTVYVVHEVPIARENQLLLGYAGYDSIFSLEYTCFKLYQDCKNKSLVINADNTTKKVIISIQKRHNHTDNDEALNQTYYIEPVVVNHGQNSVEIRLKLHDFATDRELAELLKIDVVNVSTKLLDDFLIICDVQKWRLNGIKFYLQPREVIVPKNTTFLALDSTSLLQTSRRRKEIRLIGMTSKKFQDNFLLHNHLILYGQDDCSMNQGNACETNTFTLVLLGYASLYDQLDRDGLMPKKKQGKVIFDDGVEYKF